MTMRLLVVEEERETAEVLQAVLEHGGYLVDEAGSGEEALERVRNGEYDIIILDLRQAEERTLLQHIRTEGTQAPVLLLASDSALPGADRNGEAEYLPKPFDREELLARVRSLLPLGGSRASDVLEVGNVELNCSTYEMSAEGRRVRLSNREFQLMECFMRNPERVFSSRELMKKIGESEDSSEIHVVWTNLTCLRKKLAELHSNAEICSPGGAGYCLKQKQTA